MKFKSIVVKPVAKLIAKNIDRWSKNAIATQTKIFSDLVEKAKDTNFGKDHNFAQINSYDAFREQVPIGDYEILKPYIEKIKQGERDVLWPGKPLYFAKTSGTTSGAKYIPLTKASLPNHFGTARNALFNYYARTGKGNWLDGKMIFLSGSPELIKVGGINTGRLSGIVNHQVPAWIRSKSRRRQHLILGHLLIIF